MSSEATIDCRVRLSDADFIMQNHRVHGVSILPGVTFLDIVYRILAAQKLDHQRAILRNILFPEAVVTRTGFDRDMRISMVELDDRRWHIKAESRWLEGEQPRSGWKENFRCDLSFDDEPPPGRIDIAVLKSGARQRREMEDLYRWASAEGIRHGAAMKCHGALYIGDSYLLGELRLDPSAVPDVNRFHLHPAELDASTIAAFARTPPTEHVPYIPVFIERFRAHEPLPEGFYLYSPQADVRVPSGDLLYSDYFLHDGEGECVAEFRRLMCKRIRQPELITRAVEEIGATPAAGRATSATPARSAAAPRSPNDAVSLFRARLCDIIARRLGRPVAAIKTDVPYYDLGLDSLAMLRICQELEALVDHSLYPTLLFEYGNIDALATHLARTYTLHEPPAQAQEPAGGREGSAQVPVQAACYRSEWCPAEAPRNARTTALGDVVIFGADDDLQRASYRRLADASTRVIRVVPGTRFSEVDPGVYELDLTSREQLRSLLQALDSAGTLPRHYVCIAEPSSGDVPRASDAVRSCLSLWALATELAARPHERGCNVRLMYRQQDGQGPAQYAAAGALARALSDEAPTLRARVVALDGGRSATAAADIIRQDLLDETAESEVRFQDGRRQVKRYLPYALASPVNGTGLRSRGVYVLAGAGGISRLIADRLAEDWKAHLVFIGRRPLQESLKARFPHWRAHGADVTYVQADIANEAEAVAALARARERFGRIDGIFHCAGTVADGLFFRKDASDIVRVLAPKIMGAIHLDAATRHDDLDFFVMFSSLSASMTNLGQCDYAFANAFLEHFAEWRAGRSDRSGKTLAIGWPLWAEGGMQVAPEVKERSRQQTGIVPLPTGVALDILFRGLAGPVPCFAVTYGAPDETGRIFRAAPVATSESAATPVVSGAHVAIIGVAGQYPQARDVDEFWHNLLAGRDCIVEVPADRWDHSLFFDPVKGRTGKTYSKWGGFLDGVDLFDPGLFGISRKDAERMDPQERLFLKTSWLALHDAGYTPQALAGETVGVFAGVMWNHYQLLEDPESATAPTAMHAAVANRVSYCFDFRGPSVAVDTACSSSLTALHLAVESIRHGECSVALAGGVNVTIHPQKYLQLAQGQFLSSDGRCRSFGKDGSGYVPGEGVGAVLLKALPQALADGDQIYAVIKGSFLNHTGRTSGFTVPSPDSQADLIREAIARASVAFETIGYLEAHGTGTSLGDPIEITGLQKAFAEGSLPRQSCALGSVKSNIGHLESAAGIAGLTKVLLQMKHGTLVPSLHAEEVNPLIDLRNSAFFIPRQPLPWRPQPGAPLRAGVSAFGAGGANVHVVLESCVPAASPQRSDGPFLVVLSARDEPALKSYAESMISFLAGGAIASHLPAGAVRQEFVREVVADMIGVPRDAVNPQESLRDLGFDAVRLAELAERTAADSPNGGSPATLTLDATVESVASCAAAPRPDGSPSLEDVAYTLQVGRTPMAARLAIVTNDVSGLRSGLSRFLRGTDHGDDECWNFQPATAASEADAELLVELFQAGKLRDVARRWVAGANVPWRRCYPRPGESRSPRRMSLPSPPFTEERCWVGRWKSQSQSNGIAHTKSDAEGPGPGARSRAERGGSAAAKSQHAGSEPVMRIVDGGVAVIAMRDPDHANMFTERVLDEVQTAFADVARRPEIKAVVVTGTGNVFSMGADQESLEKLVAREARFTDSPFLYEGLLRCDRPVVAAIQGHASGGGLIFGLYADVVLMAREGVYSANFLKYGFTPGLGATYLLETRFGPSLAAEMFYTGRSFTGEELERRGAQVAFLPQAQVLERALDLARSIAEQPPHAVQALKRELAGRVLKKLPDVVASEDAMHDRVLDDGAVQRIRDHFRKVEHFGRPAAAAQRREAETPVPEPMEAQVPARHEQASSADYDAIVAVIESALCAHLYVERREIDRQLTFHEMGVDSIGAVEIVRDLNRCFDLALESSTVYDYPTVPNLAEFVLGRCAEEGKRAARPPVAATAGRGAVQFAQPETCAPTDVALANDLVALPPLTSPSTPASAAAPASSEYKVVLAPSDTGAFAAGERLDPTPAARATDDVIVLAPTHPAKGASSSSSAASSGADTSALTRSTSVERSPRSVPAGSSPVTPPAKIAVIGMSGRFPDAPDLNAFWANLRGGRCSVREVPSDRWDYSSITDPETHCRWGAFVDDVDRFDAAFFHLSPMEAELMDPQQRVFLQHAWGALEDAGYAGAAGSTQRCGVFVGCGAGDYLRLLEEAGAADAGHVFLGNAPSILAARIAYFLNLNGPTIALDTACSSSLVAVHMACESIRNGECDLALAGGVALMLTPTMHVWTSKLAILSPTGRCAPFDQSANGIVLGEGVGVVALKALEKALEDGDHIHGVIAASGVNGDGKTNGITAPSALSQIALLESVHARAGLTGEDITYVEAHGTGTPLGDPIELRALNHVFRQHTSRTGCCGVGSVKSNIGHTTLAAGIAGLIKVLLSLKHAHVPPSVNFHSANPDIDFDSSPFVVVTEGKDWRPGKSGRRIGAVSSFGFSGTNCHVVVEEAPPSALRRGEPEKNGYFIVPVSAKTEDALRDRLRQLSESLTNRPHLADLSYTLAVARQHFRFRTAFVVRSLQDLSEALSLVLAGEKAPRAFHHTPGMPAPDLPVSGSGGDTSSADYVERLARSYVQGRDPDWTRIYEGCASRRISLPTYPFARDRHWIKGGGLPSAESVERHVLLGRRLPHTAGAGVVFANDIRPDNVIVADHRVNGSPILPAAACLEMALAAAAAEVSVPVRLTSVRWLQPLEIERPRTIRFSVVPDGARWVFELHVADEQVPYARGTVSPAAERSSSESVDLRAFAARCPDNVSRQQIYAAFDCAGIHYGPAFQALASVSFGEDCALGKLSAPRGSLGDPSRLELNPCLLDAALQAAAVLESQSGDGPRIPVSLDSLELLRPLTAPAFTCITRTGDHIFDVVIADPEGHVCVSCKGFALRATRTEREATIRVPGWRDAGALLPSAPPSTRRRQVAIYHEAGADVSLIEELGRLHADDEVFEAQLGRESLHSPVDVLYVLASADGPPAAPEESGPALIRLVKELVSIDQPEHPLELKIVLTGEHRRVALPTYFSAKDSYRVESAGPVAQVAAAAMVASSEDSIRTVPPRSASEPETLRLLPVWEAVTPERSAATPSPADHVVVVGVDERLVSRLASRYRNLLAVTIGAGDDVDVIARAVSAIERIDHVIWIAPDAGPRRPIDGRMIVEQQAGVLQLFRLIKALLGRRLGRTPVGWTVITFRCQAIHAADPIDPTHAAVHGLVGSMAKEYEHWKVRLLDLASQDALDEIDVATLPFDARGNALACRDGHWYRQTLIPMEDQPHGGESASLYRRGATYVVIGGAGGLGRVWTEYVARRYHAQVVWIGRRPLDDAIAGVIAAVGESGPAPIYIAADASRRVDLERARAEITQRFGDIHGIVHSAIVLLDQTLANLTEERFVASLGAKIDTSVLLADVFRSEPLDFFLFFSSMNSFTRGPGQSSYAAGCVFKDALARHLAQSRSAAIRVINWGYWGEVGVVASPEYRWRMAQFGVASIEPADAMQPLETLLTGPVHQLGLLKATKKLHGIEYSECATVQAQRAGSRAAMSAVEQTLARLSDYTEAVGDTAALATFNALLTDLLFAQLRRMGLDSEPRTALEIEHQCDIAARYRRWLDGTLAILARRQYLSVADDRFSIAKHEPLPIEVLWQRWHAQKAAWASAPLETALMGLAEPALEALPDVLRGSQPPTRVLFPRGSMDLVEGIYKHNPVADHFNNVVADCVAAHVSAVLEESPAAGIRILEVGAGTGAATAAVLAKLTPYRKDIVEYCYTDLSPAFLLHAQAQYGPANPFLSYAILNLSQPPATQNVACGAYDIVIASNVLHATRNVRQAVRNAKAALTRGGVLVLSELSRITLFTHVTFGLLDGWWQNDDGDLRMRGGPLLATRTWRHVLESEGFVNVAFSADTPYEFGQQVIVAASDGVVRQPTREPSPSDIAELMVCDPAGDFRADGSDQSRLMEGAAAVSPTR